MKAKRPSLSCLAALIVCLVVLLSSGTVSAADFPDKPVKIIVYTKPGGLIDVTARKLAQILERKYVNQPVVVENKAGAGGVVAMQYVSRQRPYGHTLLALTSSVISKLVSAKQTDRLNDFHLLARLVDDYECLIVNKSSQIDTLEDLLSDAKQRPGGQIWVGPASGGTDHLFALKFWKAAGVSGKWIPYTSGGEAIAALLGNHGQVYVGNPQDALGRPDLAVLATASPKPLALFQDVPTFASAGLGELSGESLWRGVAVHKSTDPAVIQHWEGVFGKLQSDSEWTSFVEEGAAVPVFDTHETFKSLVDLQLASDQELLSKLG